MQSNLSTYTVKRHLSGLILSVVIKKVTYICMLCVFKCRCTEGFVLQRCRYGKFDLDNNDLDRPCRNGFLVVVISCVWSLVPAVNQSDNVILRQLMISPFQVIVVDVSYRREAFFLSWQLQLQAETEAR